MAKPTDYYVADAGNGGSDSNNGTTPGTPWLTIEKALGATGITRNATNGDRINVAGAPGTPVVLAAPLDVTVNYGTPNEGAPLVIQGYSGTGGGAGDGGIGSIDCNAGAMFAATYSGIMLADLDIFNGGSSTLVVVGTYGILDRCNVHGTTGTGVNLNGGEAHCINSEIYDCGAVGITAATGSSILFNRLRNGPTNNFVSAITGQQAQGFIMFNTIQLGNSGGGSNGMLIGYGMSAMYNSIWSNAGTGKGISRNTGGAGQSQFLVNNIVDGFSGGGGIGFGGGATGMVSAKLIHGNYLSNCATNISIADEWISRGVGSNPRSANTDGGTTAPFTSPSTGDFTPLAAVTDLLNSWPPSVAGQVNYLWKGAVQPQVTGGGGGIILRQHRIQT